MIVADDDDMPAGSGPGRGPRKESYEVGYGKPPKNTQFQPGRSGNPRGRPKGARGLRTDLETVLREPLTIQINGKSYKGTPQLLALKTMAMQAATGNDKARQQLVDLVLRLFGAEDRGGGKTALSPQDQAILDTMLALLEGDPVDRSTPSASAAEQAGGDPARPQGEPAAPDEEPSA